MFQNYPDYKDLESESEFPNPVAEETRVQNLREGRIRKQLSTVWTFPEGQMTMKEYLNKYPPEGVIVKTRKYSERPGQEQRVLKKPVIEYSFWRTGPTGEQAIVRINKILFDYITENLGVPVTPHPP